LKVRITDRAKKRYASIVLKIRKEWGEATAIAFEKRTKDFIIILSEFPEIGVLEVPKKQIRAFQLTKINRVYYRISKSEVVIFHFFDVRKNPTIKPK